MTTLFRGRSAARGQAMVEFGLTLGLFVLVIGGLIQFAMILWSQNTINQIARDTARWEVTQSVVPCDSSGTRGAIATHANSLATEWTLLARPNWSPATVVSAVPASGVGVDWRVVDPPTGMLIDPLTDCPASDNRLVWVVTVRVNHSVPIIIPGLQFIAPSCGAPGFCISSTTELRMEPKRPL